MGVKISIIGAGSAVFSLSLIKDICLTPNLQDSSVSFMDIDRGRLDAAYRLCRRYAAESGINLQLHKTTDRREALEGSDFVINTALAGSEEAGGHQRLQDGWAIAYKHGYRFGGSLHIVHDEAFWINFYQYRLMEAILVDMLDVCPDAWYLLVANPVMAGITYLQRKYPQAKTVGLCHGFHGVHGLADTLGLDRKGITYELPGVNHFIWLTDFRYEGEDAFPLLDRWIEEEAEQYWKTCGTSDGMGPKAIDLYRRFGAFPVGDTGNPGGGSWGFWYHTDRQTEKKWQEDPYGWFYDGYFPSCARSVAQIDSIAKDESIKVTEKYPPEPSGESMIPIVESIACDIPRTMIVNTLNDAGYVDGIPRDFQVEVPALVSKLGIQGIKTNGLPRSIVAYVLGDRVAPAEMELLAFSEGSRDLLLSLIMMDPWTRSEDQARALLDDILALPYHAEMREHYR